MQYEVNINKYDLDLSGITTLTFEVKACQDATIVMSNSDDGNSSMPMYQFIFCGWENEKSAIRKQDQGVEVNTLGVCKCDEYRSFWISGDLRIGKGLNVGINVIAEWTDPDPFTIRSIGIYTWGGTGEWKVQLEGNIVFFS
ncbi:uncharacterized protein [Mytilus edulis]|uniref:uncharacterized protein n=1 Tax=Mytilus edulis TaxID=6550 RepID=UPI0039F1420E